MKITADDIQRYAPYHAMKAFRIGYQDCEVGIHKSPYDPGSLEAPAWDAGHECGKEHIRLAADKLCVEL
jgi:hypothetical protein